MSFDEETIPEPTPQDLAIWGRISTHAEFGEATADWLTRKHPYYPTYLSPGPAAESADLIEGLATINRLGFVTDSSQPGVPVDDAGSGQRAYVTGYCDEATAETIASALRFSDLIVLHFSPDSLGDGSIVVSTDEGEEFTWVGRRDSISAAEGYRERAGDSLADLILASWELHIIDPAWGRNDRLIPALLHALGADS
ncbi:hypothetical protein [Nocardioides sp. 616]|uniref:DUF6919 domain-containing protein n=1 Tax=Nocardioides sp. 616 TaxID=2268090 RepID=UPI0013B3B1C6|nr:hypothetical protein [Nocardioides sp. 616]